MLNDNHIGYWVLAILAKILVPAIGNITKCSYIKTLMLRKLTLKLTYYVLKGRKTEQVGILDWLSVSADIIGYRNI